MRAATVASVFGPPMRVACRVMHQQQQRRTKYIFVKKAK
jgi:hypothetical protein